MSRDDLTRLETTLGEGLASDAATYGHAGVVADAGSRATGATAPDLDGRPRVDLFDTLGIRPENLTERGVSTAFVRMYGDNLLHVEQLGAWFVWDGTHFSEDRDRTVRHLLGRVVDDLARDSLATRDPKLVTLALRCLQSRHVQGADQLSRDARKVARLIEHLDPPGRTAHLLTTPAAGTIDLRTGIGRPPDRADHFTRITAVSPAPMPTPVWDACLARWTCDRPRLGAYLRRLVGYCLTGEIREHILVLLLGDGGNGKGTFVTVLMEIWGLYGTVLTMDTLKLQKFAQHPTDLMDLRGARLAVAIETESDERLDEAKIKMLTGGDPVRARRMRQDFVTFSPTHKLMIYGNHTPKLRHVDEAIRRRLHLIRFDAVIPAEEKDPTLGVKLRAEYPGILQWAIGGAVEYYRDGLRPPPEVLSATDEYLAGQDALARWLEESCVLGDPNSQISKQAAWESWTAWTEREREEAGTKRTFLQLVGKRYPQLDEYNRHSERGWIGLRLRHDGDPEP
jgi:putative DNA primase/helicase